MSQTQPTSPDKGNKLKLIELSVVLVADSNNPSILNPDFLHYNKIVDKDYEVQGSPVSTPAFSQVVFKNGVRVTSAPDRVIFTQDGTLDEENIVSPAIAKRYVEHIRHVPYNAIGINPKRFVSGQYPNAVAEMLQEGGSWTKFKGMLPEVQLRTIYNDNERKIILDIAGARRAENSESKSGMLFQANIHRDLKETDVKLRIKHLFLLLDSWKNELKDFFELTDMYFKETL